MSDGALHALIVTLLIEVPIVVAFFPRKWKRLGLVALGANALTNVVLNVGLPALGVRGTPRILVGEAFALVFEAAAYAIASGARARSAIASGVSNIASFTLGGVLAHWIW